MCADYRIVITYECEYLFRRGSKRWLLSQILDPKDPDPRQHAILASLVEALVDVFNWKLELGLRRGNMRPDQSEDRATNFVREVSPAWTKNVAGLEKHVSLIDRKLNLPQYRTKTSCKGTLKLARIICIRYDSARLFYVGSDGILAMQISHVLKSFKKHISSHYTLIYVAIHPLILNKRDLRRPHIRISSALSHVRQSSLSKSNIVLAPYTLLALGGKRSL
ncbi:hypothetical protein CJF31_00004037 [Rutstroemia sp. NJR-2017a BVV2]|nr:hypothetical protein CJF31_00004037 [Rutstroemia sp. NJR-2017a BVV2]